MNGLTQTIQDIILVTNVKTDTIFIAIQDTLSFSTVEKGLGNILIENLPLFFVSFFTIVIAIYSLYKQNKNFSLLLKEQKAQYEQNKKHLIMSVKPFLIYTYLIDSRKKIYVIIENSGIGPAIIRNFKATLGDKTSDSLGRFLPKEVSDNIKSDQPHIGDGYGIIQGGTLTIMSNEVIGKSTETENELKELKNYFNGIKIEMEYSDIYHSKWYQTSFELRYEQR